MSEWERPGRRRPIDAAEAAFAGFGLIRQRPTLFFGLMAMIVVLGALSSLLQVMVAGPAVTQLMELQTKAAASGERLDPSVVLPLMGPIWRMNLILLPAILLFYGVTNAAVYRAMLRPAQRGFGYLRFGADELRQVGAMILLGLTMIGVAILAEIALILLVVVGGLAMGAARGAGHAPLLAVGLVFGAVVLVLGPIILVAVKLSLSGPMTFAQRRVRVTGSWALTKGRFWPMFGAYFLAGVLMVLAAIALIIVSCAIAFMVGGVGGVRGMFVPDSRSISSFFTPERLVLMVLNAPVGALWIGLQAAVPAALYAQIAGGPVDDGDDRSHAFGSEPPPPPPPMDDYPIVPPRTPSPPDDSL